MGVDELRQEMRDALKTADGCAARNQLGVDSELRRDLGTIRACIAVAQHRHAQILGVLRRDVAHVDRSIAAIESKLRGAATGDWLGEFHHDLANVRAGLLGLVPAAEAEVGGPDRDG